MFSSPTAFKEDATEATNVAISARQIDSGCKTGDFFFLFKIAASKVRFTVGNSKPFVDQFKYKTCREEGRDKITLIPKEKYRKE